MDLGPLPGQLLFTVGKFLVADPRLLLALREHPLLDALPLLPADELLLLASELVVALLQPPEYFESLQEVALVLRRPGLHRLDSRLALPQLPLHVQELRVDLLALGVPLLQLALQPGRSLALALHLFELLPRLPEPRVELGALLVEGALAHGQLLVLRRESGLSLRQRAVLLHHALEQRDGLGL